MSFHGQETREVNEKVVDTTSGGVQHLGLLGCQLYQFLAWLFEDSYVPHEVGVKCAKLLG